jgi:hypothetical protein
MQSFKQIFLTLFGGSLNLWLEPRSQRSTLRIDESFRKFLVAFVPDVHRGALLGEIVGTHLVASVDVVVHFLQRHGGNTMTTDFIKKYVTQL